MREYADMYGTDFKECLKEALEEMSNKRDKDGKLS
jgi:uncharacterized protein with von Willebrand factor type A (vWA) domain